MTVGVEREGEECGSELKLLWKKEKGTLFSLEEGILSNERSY